MVASIEDLIRPGRGRKHSNRGEGIGDVDKEVLETDDVEPEVSGGREGMGRKDEKTLFGDGTDRVVVVLLLQGQWVMLIVTSASECNYNHGFCFCILGAAFWDVCAEFFFHEWFDQGQ